MTANSLSVFSIDVIFIVIVCVCVIIKPFNLTVNVF